MQKIIRLETENTPLERWTENSACEIYSHDTNNGQFEIEVMNEALTDETVTALFIFEESQSVWRTTGTIEENKIKFKFDTTLITQDETVLCVLYLDNERENNDFYRFNFKVKVSEIDKLDNLTVKERFFKNNLIVDRLDVVTKTELQEILKTIDLSNISTDGLLTEEKANGLYAKISELEALERQIPSVSTFITEETLRTAKNDVVAEINNRLENYALKTSIPEPYNDTNLVNRVSDLEQKQDKDTIYNDEPIKERLIALENGNFATKQELGDYAKKTELPQPYDDTALVQKIGQLETKVDNDTIYDDTPLKERVTALESKAIEGGAYNDTELRNRVTELENKPPLDISNFVTNQVLESKNYITEEILNNKGFAKTSEIPAPYNDTALSDRVTALENKQDNDTVYNDSEVKQRLTNLENKPNIDLTDYETFKNMVVTKGYLEKQKFLTEQYNDKPLTDRVIALENKTTTNQFEIHGTGMPNGVVTAELGTTYVDKNKTNGALKWIKTTDGGNTGWEVLIGDTGWRTLNSVSRAGNSFIKIRRVNNLVTYQFGGLQWGWFGVGKRNGPGFVRHNSSGDKGAKLTNPNGIPEGFRSESSLVGPIYDDKGRAYGIWYLGGVTDLNFIQFTFNDPIPTDRDIGDIRVSAISYLTNEPWPTKLP